MLKAHCDNCDRPISQNAVATRRVTVQPWGYQCVITMMVRKEAELDQELCVDCLKAAAEAFIRSLSYAVV